MFSIELAYGSRKYPSPQDPKAVPDRQATPASLSRRAASTDDGMPTSFTFGNT